jgi:hypothetical protein
MTAAVKEKAIGIVSGGIANIIHSYSENALLINACFVAAKRYENLTDTNGLSTTANIPEPLKLENEIEVWYANADLVNKYQGDVMRVVINNYVIASVSLVDAVLEDLYEYLLHVYTPGITEAETEKQVRSAWTNDNMINFFTDAGKADLRKPATMNTTFAEAYMRYTELRIVRHTLLHAGGKLSDKNYNKLQANLAATPEERKHFALAKAPIFDADRSVSLDINHMLSFRQYLYNYLFYLRKSISEK